MLSLQYSFWSQRYASARCAGLLIRVSGVMSRDIPSFDTSTVLVSKIKNNKVRVPSQKVKQSVLAWFKQ